MNGRITQTGTLLSLLILAGSVVACRQASALAGELDVPTTTVKQADVQLKTLTTGALRSKDSRVRSEEHTSELQSHSDLVCRLLLEKKKGSWSGCRRTGDCRLS